MSTLRFHVTCPGRPSTAGHVGTAPRQAG